MEIFCLFFQVPTEPLTGKLHLVCASEDTMKDILDLDPEVAETEEFIDFVAGKYLPDGGITVCHRCELLFIFNIF